MMTNLVIDLDDTLLDCGIEYERAKKRVAEYLAIPGKISADEIYTFISDIDVAMTKLPNAFSKNRFIQSCMLAAYHVDDSFPAEYVDYRAVKDIAESVFGAEYRLYDEAEQVLTALQGRGYRLILCTKGEKSIQNSKIVKNRLDRFFSEENIYIVPKKDTDTFKVLKSLYPGDIFMIGDSLRDDIDKSQKAGFTATVHFNNSRKPSWGYESAYQEVKADYTIDNLLALLKLFPETRPHLRPQWQDKVIENLDPSRPLVLGTDGGWNSIKFCPPLRRKS